jgi:hypothetical protein
MHFDWSPLPRPATTDSSDAATPGHMVLSRKPKEFRSQAFKKKVG